MEHKIAILSDIHGNLPALEEVLADARKKGATEYIFLGDLTSKGPFGQEVADLLRELPGAGIRGGGEEQLSVIDPEAFFPPTITTKEERVAIWRWERNRLNKEAVAFLTSFPLVLERKIGRRCWHFFHATPWNTTDLLYPEAPADRFAALFSADQINAVCYGHIHSPFLRHIGPRLVVNAGSVGQPLDGDPRAAYLLISDQAVEFVRVEYDIEKTLAAAEAAGMPGLDNYRIMLREARWPYKHQHAL